MPWFFDSAFPCIFSGFDDNTLRFATVFIDGFRWGAASGSDQGCCRAVKL
jgi:hypothetical protein